MENLEKPKILQQAMKALETAQQEINRPKEDVVTYMVCSHLRNATFDFLTYFLSMHNVDTRGADTILELKLLCEQIDDSFNEVDFSSIPCFDNQCDEHSNFCQEVNKVMGCLNSVERVKELVFLNTRKGLVH